jgi:hypothetical protein
MAGAEIFVISMMFRSAVRPAKPHIQWVTGGCFLEDEVFRA